MGCWNGTCAMSKLPIFHGDRVVCWFIVESQGYSRGDATSFCYPHGHYELMAAPFRAEYNDYGGVENIDAEDEDIVKLLIETLRAKLVEVEEGENECHDIPVTKAEFDFELAMEAIHEGRLHVTGYGDNRAVGMIMVHETVLNKMIETYRWENYTWPDGYDGNAVKVISQFDLNALAKDLQDAVEEDTKHKWRMWDKLDRNFREVYGMRHIVGELLDNNVPLEHELFQKLFKQAAMTQVLTTLAYNLRMHFGPQSGAGSQQGEYEPYHALINAMQYTMKLREDEIASWDDDDEDEALE